MKRSLSVLITGLLILLCGQIIAQEYTAKTPGESMLAPGVGTVVRARGSSYHKIAWTLSGTIDTCQVKLEKSSDGAAWSDLIAALTCTTEGSSALVKDSAPYVRPNVTAISGGGSVQVAWTGYSGEPVRRAARVATGTILAGLRQDVILTWPQAFPAGDYACLCSVLDESAAGLGVVVERVRSRSTSSVTVQIFNMALASGSGTVECVGFWPGVYP